MRKIIAWTLLLVWVGVISWNTRRELFRPEADRLALGASTLPPGVAYYYVDRGQLSAGWASIEIDTLPEQTGFLIRERYNIRIPGLGQAGQVETQGETWLSSRVELDSLTRSIVRGSDTVRIRAAVRGDSLEWESSTDSTTRRLPADVLQTAASWPLRFAAAGGSEEGETRLMSLLDPVAGTVRQVELRVTEEGTRVFADSADSDPESGEWFIAGRDTVSAWQIEPAAGQDLPTWVDEDGRILEADIPGAMRLKRTAFELAFFRDQVARQ